MEYLEDNEEARMMAAEMFVDCNHAGDIVDPEGKQEQEDNQQDHIQQLEEFDYADLEFVEQPADDAFEKSYKPIEVRPLEVLREEARRMDFYQRKVLEKAVKQARRLVKARSGKNPLPTPPLVMVDGAAGSGKSSTINILKEVVQMILQQTGDDPNCPHVLLCAPTGTAAVNIKGQTMHSAFSFTFGDEHYSLSDKTRDTKRAMFKNLRFLIVDEVSMVKADQLYQLDLRLREVTMRPDKLFGGVSIFFFGDIMQLKPVKGRVIWGQPRSSEYYQAFLIKPHWEEFEVISLVENHRQQGDAMYADMLNRIRVGEQTDEDLSVLQERVRPTGHPDMLGAMVIASTHAIVNMHNNLCLQQLAGVAVNIEALNSHSNIPNFQPRLHKKKRTIDPTPYLQTLSVKIGCRVMLVANIDVRDMLCNGSIGILEGMVKDRNHQVTVLMVKFDCEDSGMEMRRCHPHLSKSFPGCTPIMKQVHKYSTSKSTKGVKSQVATVHQFPLILSFASTTHKIQGQTIVAPRKVAIDLRSVFGANQAYVMMGRVQQLEQLFLIGSLAEAKIYADKGAKDQLEVLKARSLNRNPPVWEKLYGQCAKVYCHNVCSLRDKMDDLRLDPVLRGADVIILLETWLDPEVSTSDQSLQMDNFQLHLNSIGRGKGVAVYLKNERFIQTQTVSSADLQISVLESADLTVVTLYRSQADRSLAEQLAEVIPPEGRCLVIGDFNICSRTNSNQEVFTNLVGRGFILMVSEATHLGGGRIDQAWFRGSAEGSVNLQLYSPYYTCKDHDALLFTAYDKSTAPLDVNVIPESNHSVRSLPQRRQKPARL